MPGAGRTIRIIVLRQQDETIRPHGGKSSDPFGVKHRIGTGETRARNSCTNCCVELPPIRKKRVHVITLRASLVPASEPVRLIADLEGEKSRANRLGDVGGLIGGRLRRSPRQIEPIDEPPSQDGQSGSKAINARGRYFEVIRTRHALRPPDRALTRVAANANDAVIAE